MKWVNVSDNLPDSNRRVLFILQLKNKTLVRCGRFEKNNGWYVNTFDGSFRVDEHVVVRFWSEIDLPIHEGL